jgi:hypothetical protein
VTVARGGDAGGSQDGLQGGVEMPSVKLGRAISVAAT